MAREAYFKLSKGKIEFMDCSSEFAQMVGHMERHMPPPSEVSVKHGVKNDDLIFSIFKEDGEEVISLGSVRYGLKITLEELEQIYNFIKSEEMHAQVTAQLV